MQRQHAYRGAVLRKQSLLLPVCSFRRSRCCRETSQLAVHLSNDNAMRRLLRDGVGINEVQKKYLSLCYVSLCWDPGMRCFDSGCWV